MNSDIISLSETSANNWQAKYSGNYGNYTIKIKLNEDKETSSFSCSCPSDNYPCKHISIIESAIRARIKEEKKIPKEKEVTVEEILKNVPHKELIDFIIVQAKYNPQLTNSILLKFAQKSKKDSENKYTLILRKALKGVSYDFDDLYEYQDSCIEIDILDEWLEKAKQHIALQEYKEAIAICKACIEEYSEWMQDTDSEIIESIDYSYQKAPFEILIEAATAAELNKNELFKYCMAEMVKPKYAGTNFYDGFNNILMQFAGTDNGVEFLNLQDALLNNVTDNSSNEAEKILQRKVDYYNKNNQTEFAKNTISKNIQIESFRKEVVKQKIGESKYTEAKKLIDDFLSAGQHKDVHYNSDWYELLLEISQKEKDIPAIRKVSFAFIESYFKEKYYRIYKSTFSADDWIDELEKIIGHYSKESRFFSDSVADVLAEEKDAERLIKYIEKNLEIEKLDKYHTHFSKLFPEATLALFQKAINHYAEKNTGRNYYEYIARMMKKMHLIKDGKQIVKEMINQYKIQYKSRRAMVEVLDKI